MWNLEGLTVKGYYLGTTPVEGVVTNSRVKFGGTVQHNVDLYFPITMFACAPLITTTTVLLDANEVAFVEYESTTACEFDT
jgi:hypothetical protein